MLFDKKFSFSPVYPSLDVSAKFKLSAEDFMVEENIPFQLSGEGEHCWVYIQKRGCNTDWLAQQLAKYCGVKQMAVSYAGLKDRHAITTQWFSVQLPGLPTPNWTGFEDMFETGIVKVLQSSRHQKKLQRGALKSNFFKITLHDLSCNDEDMLEKLKQRCLLISQKGVANYFGPQRFGRNGNNLDQAEKFFLKPNRRLPRHKRSIYLSAARSWMFNCILSERIKRKLWDVRLAGDVFMLDGKSACFRDEAEQTQNEQPFESLNERLSSGEIHPTAILWGEGESMVAAQAKELEMEVIDKFPVYRDGLIAARLQSQRRSCRVIPGDMNSYARDKSFVVSFSLPAGSYATVVLAEIFSELIDQVP